MRASDHRRRLAAVIWAAVCMIVLVLSAAPALAHRGHAHESEASATGVVVYLHSSASKTAVIVHLNSPVPMVSHARMDAIGTSESASTADSAIAAASSGAAAKRPADPPFDLSRFAPSGQSSVPAGTCNGACCGAAACCGTALPVAPTAHAPPHLLAQRVFRPESPAISGVEPGRLPEPPRSFA